MALTQVSTGGIKDGQVQTADLADAQITAAKLHADALDRTYTLGASGNNHYTFTGEGLTGAVNDPTLYLTRGKTYRFVNGNSTGAHPFRIQSTAGSSGTEYNTGVTNNAGAGGSTIIFEVPHDAPDVLYYQCTSHGSMGGILYVTGALADGTVTTAKLADDAVNNDKLADSVVAAIAANTAKTSNATHTGDVTGSTSLTIANDAVTTAKIADDAVTADKLANSINTAIAANTAKDLTALSASNLTSGTIPDARFPSTLPAVSGANLTGISSAGQARNLLINGEFLIDQRRDGQTYSCDPSGGNPVYGTVDRWQFKNYYGEAGRYDVSQSTDTPNYNFKKSLKIDITTAMGTPSGNNYSSFAQQIEAQNVAHLGFGSGVSKQVTLQFWIKSTKTGTATVGLQRDDNGRRCLLEYTINASNTWEFKTLTFPADTSGGMIPSDNGKGLRVDFVLFSSMHDNTTGWHDGSHFASKSSQVNLADSTSNNIYFAGVQLEEGTTANDFVHEDIGTTMIKCQRYYQSLARKDYVFFASGVAYGTGTAYGVANLATEMRASPSLEAYGAVSAGAYVYRVLRGGTSVYDNDIGNMNNGGKMSLTVSVQPSGLTTGEAVMIGFHGAPSGYNNRSRIAASSEI